MFGLIVVLSAEICHLRPSVVLTITRICLAQVWSESRLRAKSKLVRSTAFYQQWSQSSYCFQRVCLSLWCLCVCLSLWCLCVCLSTNKKVVLEMTRLTLAVWTTM